MTNELGPEVVMLVEGVLAAVGEDVEVLAVIPTPGAAPEMPKIVAIPPLMLPPVVLAVKENVPAVATGGLSR
jgi:hypothetical protein